MPDRAGAGPHAGTAAGRSNAGGSYAADIVTEGTATGAVAAGIRSVIPASMDPVIAAGRAVIETRSVTVPTVPIPGIPVIMRAIPIGTIPGVPRIPNPGTIVKRATPVPGTIPGIPRIAIPGTIPGVSIVKRIAKPQGAVNNNQGRSFCSKALRLGGRHHQGVSVAVHDISLRLLAFGKEIIQFRLRCGRNGWLGRSDRRTGIDPVIVHFGLELARGRAAPGG